MRRGILIVLANRAGGWLRAARGTRAVGVGGETIRIWLEALEPKRTRVSRNDDRAGRVGMSMKEGAIAI